MKKIFFNLLLPLFFFAGIGVFFYLNAGKIFKLFSRATYVKANLAGYKVPRDVTFVDELPRNASGKIMTRELP